MVCRVHEAHSPRPLTLVPHTMTPVRWQLLTPVDVPYSAGPDPGGRGNLWDDRRILVCPTGHDNVHHWIVKLMEEIASVEASDEVLELVVDRVKKVNNLTVKNKDFWFATQSLQRYVANGITEKDSMSLYTLTQQNEFGKK